MIDSILLVDDEDLFHLVLLKRLIKMINIAVRLQDKLVKEEDTLIKG